MCMNTEALNDILGRLEEVEDDVLQSFEGDLRPSHVAKMPDLLLQVRIALSAVRILRQKVSQAGIVCRTALAP